jgi:hypothetical protein
MLKNDLSREVLTDVLEINPARKKTEMCILM